MAINLDMPYSSLRPTGFFIGSLAYALDGPLLYLYVVSLIRPKL